MIDPFSVLEAVTQALGLGPGMTAALFLAGGLAVARSVTLVMAGAPARAAGTLAGGGLFLALVWLFAQAAGTIGAL